MASINVNLQRDWTGTADASFTLQSNASWLTPSATSGSFTSNSQTKSISITTQANASADSRSGNIVAKSSPAGAWETTLSVTQDGAPTYALTYDLDGGSIANYNGGTPPGNYVSGYQITAPTTIPTKSGQNFDGWSSSATGAILSPGEADLAGMMAGGVTFTAQWSSRQVVFSPSSLSLNADGTSK
jgi:uncharacterized repeat protein (TIGR02543 family)